MKQSTRLVGKLFLVLAMLAAAGTARSSEDGLVKDMVHFDQAYIPVLAMTSDEKLVPARRALANLLPVWQSFKSRHYADTRGDAQWQSNLDEVGRHIDASEKIIRRGTNLKEAHEELEHIRFVLMQLRERHGIDYYIDHLTRFHEPMETIVLAARGKTEKSLTDNDLDVIRKNLPMAKKLWQQTSTTEFDAALFEFDKTQTANLRSLVEKEVMALRHLERVLQTDNKTEIIATAVSIKPNFAKIFKSFGHFAAGG